jgi:hypothetical protein
MTLQTKLIHWCRSPRARPIRLEHPLHQSRDSSVGVWGHARDDP